MICDQCIGEPYLQARIQVEGARTRCSVCRQTRVCVDDDLLADWVEHVIAEQYFETSREPEGLDYLLARAGRWEQPGTDIGELITELFDAADDRVGERIRTVLSDRHGFVAVREGGEDPFAEDARYDELPVDGGPHSGSWRRFKVQIMTQSRYYNREVDRALDGLFGDLHDKRTRDGGPVVRRIGPDSEERSVYRARVVPSLDVVEKILRSPVSGLGPPPSPVASAGRMNAHGIAVFYGATDVATCISEVRPPVGSLVVTARFDIVRSVNVLDVAALANCYSSGSPFDSTSLDRWRKEKFLRGLVDEISRPILPHEEASEYLPTQIVAEYLHDRAEPAIDGMLFPSAQRGGNNLVLFHRAAKPDAYDLPKGSRSWISWGYGPPDDFTDEIEVHEELPAAKEVPDGAQVIDLDFGLPRDYFAMAGGQAPMPDERKATLRLDASSVQVHEVQGVTFDTHERDVTYRRSDYVPREELPF